MNKETLKKAKSLENLIEQCDGLLKSSRDTYFWCLVKVNCGNSNGHDDRYGCIPREIWSKMLAILKEEREKLEQELESL